jgi:hypothetical protein
MRRARKTNAETFPLKRLKFEPPQKTNSHISAECYLALENQTKKKVFFLFFTWLCRFWQGYLASISSLGQCFYSHTPNSQYQSVIQSLAFKTC